MKTLSRLLLVICLLAPISGCVWFNKIASIGSTPLSIKDGVALIQRDVAEVNPVILSDIGKTSDEAIKASIFAAQCLNDRKNPPVPVLTGAISLALTGSFTATPSGQVSWAATGPGGQLAFSVAVAKTQSLTIPLSFVSAGSLPYFYLAQNVALFNGVDPKEPTKVNAIAAFTAVAAHLQTTVDDQIKAYDDAEKAYRPNSPSDDSARRETTSDAKPKTAPEKYADARLKKAKAFGCPKTVADVGQFAMPTYQ